MRTRAVEILSVAALAALATCSGFDNFEVEVTGSTVIPEGTIVDELLGEVTFTGLNSFDIAQAQDFRNQGYSKDQVDSVRLVEFTLAIRGPAGASFDFLDAIAFSVEAEGLPPVEIARLDPVPVGASAISLAITPGVELQPYVIAPSMTITTNASGRRPPDETTVDASVVFDIDANVSGGCN